MTTSSAPMTAAEIHDAAIVIDAHADIEIPGRESRFVGDDGRSRVAPDKMRAGGVDAVAMAVATGPGTRTAEGFASARALADRKLEAVRELVADDENRLVMARTASEVRAAKADGLGAVILAFQNGNIVGEDPRGLVDFHDAGVRMFALTHMSHNGFADSSRPLPHPATGVREPAAEHGGLSAIGREAVDIVNGLGAMLDVTQLSTDATLQVLERSTAPVVASHSCVRSLTDVTRNLTDAEIDGIAAGGGVICVSPFRGYLFDSNDAELTESIRVARVTAGLSERGLYPFELYWEIEDEEVRETFTDTVSALLGPGLIDDMLDHLDFIVERVGIDHVGIGSDFNQGGGVAGFDEASGALEVTRALVARGYEREAVEKIWGGNFLRVFEAVCG